MKKLLVLSCGTNAHWHVVKILREKFPNVFTLIGTDSNPCHMVAASSVLDRFYQVPVSKDPDFLSEMESILRRERPDYVLPIFDFDQQMFFDGANVLEKYGIRSLSTPCETLGVYSDKVNMQNAMLKFGLPVPRTFHVCDVEKDVSYFVKPIQGNGSVGACRKLGKDLNGQDFKGNIVEEVCSGPEVTMECFVYKGRLSSICRERLWTKAGVCTRARVFKSPKLEQIGRKFATVFKTPTIFNLQFMKNGSGCYVITDVNLRCAGAMGLSYMSGWDAVSALAKTLLDRSSDEVFESLPESVPEQFVVRVNDDRVTQIAPKTVAFDLDGTLLDSRERHKRVLDVVLSNYAIEIDTADLLSYKRTGCNNVDFLVSKGMDESMARIVQRDWICAIEQEKYLAEDSLYSDAIKLLEKYDGWRRILVTARSNEHGLHETLKRLGLVKYFDEINVVNPGQCAFQEKARILTSRKALVFYGDTRSDYEAAKMADVRFEFRKNGFHALSALGLDDDDLLGGKEISE